MDKRCSNLVRDTSILLTILNAQDIRCKQFKFKMDILGLNKYSTFLKPHWIANNPRNCNWRKVMKTKIFIAPCPCPTFVLLYQLEWILYSNWPWKQSNAFCSLHANIVMWSEMFWYKKVTLVMSSDVMISWNKEK